MPKYKFVVEVEVEATDYQTAHEVLKLDLEDASAYTQEKNLSGYYWTWYIVDEVSGTE